MSLKKTLILALILCGVFYYLIYVDKPALEVEAKKDMALSHTEKSEIETVEIRNPSGTFVLRNTQTAKADGRWELASETGAFLDPILIKSLLTALSELRLDDKLPKEDIDKDVSVYGLKDSPLTIKVNNPVVKEIQFGKKNEYFGKYYLQVLGDDNIYLVPDTLYSAAIKSKQDFLDKTPIEFLDTELKSITVSNSGSAVKLDRTENGDWLIKSPLEVPASAAAVSDFSLALRSLTASKFIEKPFELSDYNIEPSGLSITLEYPNASRSSQEILFGKVQTEQVSRYYFFVSGGPMIYEVEADPSISLNKKADDFREKSVFSFASDLVKAVEAEGDGYGKISLVKEKNQWKLNGKEGDKVFIDQWLSNVSYLQAHSFPAKGLEYGFEKPKYKVSIEIGEGKKNLIIGSEVKTGNDKGEPQAKLFYAVGDDLESPFIISEDTFKKIAARAEALAVTTAP